jgi:murein DD-endopeptidase MepM/ murein hydrolase activator NlpD
VRLAARNPPRLLLAVVLLAGVAATSVVPASAASADPVSQAQAAAQNVANQIKRLEPQLHAAVAAYQQAVSRLGSSVTTALDQSQSAAALQAQADQAASVRDQTVAQLYMSGGTLELWATVFDSSNPAEFLDRVNSVQSVISQDAYTATYSAQLAARAQAAAASTSARTTSYAETAGTVQADLNRVQGLMVAAQAELATLSAKARKLEAAQQAAAALAAAEAAANSAGSSAAAHAVGDAIPPLFLALFKAAALTCPGMDWHVLAAIGQVESHDSTSAGTSSAGAEGPMQFLPSTFAHYEVDGNHDGVFDIQNPADSVFTAANMLCQNGAGRPGGLHGAIFDYNHAEWYVQMVLKIAAELAVKYP